MKSNGDILKRIKEKARLIGKPLLFMELCGTHSQTVAQHGIKNLLPRNIKLVSGPGCPICVTDQEDVDIVVGLAQRGVPIAAYGDAVSVPGSKGSLEQARQKGARIFVVYDTQEALKLKIEIPDLVFWGIGFETTAPMTAWAVKAGLNVFSSHKIFPPAMKALLEDRHLRIDGFINPGHVSAIIGIHEYEKFNIPQVVTGFEAEDVFRGVEMLLDQIIKREKKVENEYVRVVREGGNKKARDLIQEVFEIGPSRWRGLGEIPDSGMFIRKEYQKQDARWIYRARIEKIKKEIKPRKNGCRCGEVLRGVIESHDCPLFGRVCTPENPQGACMVSVEGSCNVEYRFKN